MMIVSLDAGNQLSSEGLTIFIQGDEEKTKNQIMEEKLKLFNDFKKVQNEHEVLKKDFNDKNQESLQIWVRDLQIEAVLSEKIPDDEKIEKIRELMNMTTRAKDQDYTLLKVMVENNRLVELTNLLKHELIVQKEKYILELENAKNQSKENRATTTTRVPPPIPPRRFESTNPFL